MIIKKNKNILWVCLASSATLGCSVLYNLATQSIDRIEKPKENPSNAAIGAATEMLINASEFKNQPIDSLVTLQGNLNEKPQVSESALNVSALPAINTVAFTLPAEAPIKVSFNRNAPGFSKADFNSPEGVTETSQPDPANTEIFSTNQIKDVETYVIKKGSDLSPEQRADRETAERIQILEKNIAELKRLIEMKSAMSSSTESGSLEQLAGAENVQVAQAKVLSSNEAYRERWEIKLSDVRIDKALKRWATDAGYSFRWDADRYVMVGADSVYFGTIEEAIESVLGTPGIRASQYPLEACIYKNSPPLIRITKMGDQAEECK